METIEYKLEEEDKSCPTCDSSLHEMSKEIRKELKIIPAQVKIVGMFAMFMLVDNVKKKIHLHQLLQLRCQTQYLRVVLCPLLYSHTL